MSNKKNYISAEGLEKLQKELAILKTVKRRELSKDIGIARAHGDISENAEYDAAKDAQGMNEKKISELEETIASAELLDHSRMPKDEVTIGSIVKLKNIASGDEIQYALVGEAEADFAQGKISVTSPVGKALLGHKKKSTVEIKIPAGVIEYKVLNISR